MPFLHRRLIYPAVTFALGEGSMKRSLGELSDLQYATAGELLQYQASRLRQLLSRAYSTPYYRDLVPPDLHQLGSKAEDPFSQLRALPVLTKSALQQHASDLLATPLPRRRTGKTTGGSTGQAVTVVKDRQATARERAAMWLGYGWNGIQVGDRGARFWGQPLRSRARNLTRLADFAMNRVRFSAFDFNQEGLERYWKACVRFKPTYFHGYVSMLEEFARFVVTTRKDGRSLNLRSIVATSEVLGQPQRELIESAFGCHVQVEYGCGEMGPIAYECEGGSLHLLTTELVVELLRADGSPAEPGETARIILTDLNNKAMSLVRYDIGDFGALGPACSCGRGFPVLKNVLGRAYDVIVAPDGAKFHGEFFMYLFEEIRRQGSQFTQFQVIQRDASNVTIKIIADPRERQSLAATIRQRLRSAMPGMVVTFEWVDLIARLPSGKAQVIANQWLRGTTA